MADSPIDSPSLAAWNQPKSPLSPTQISRLANSFGIATPIPTINTRYASPSSPGASSDGRPSSPGFTSTTSKYLLRVIPTSQLPHDSSESSELSLPLPAASGYHSQFRRGILVPVHPTLQSQLWAIAREYALPSTAGLVLYLVDANQRRELPSGPDVDDDIEPGPRLSEDIWKHIWTRVLKAEQRDEHPLLPSRSLSPLSLGMRSTPHLPRARTTSLSTSESETLPAQSFPYPSPSTPSSIRSISKWNGQSDIDTPGTSIADDDSEQLHLPGLTSSSLIPILAKVEFDIDQRKATWFEPWLRSRRMNHAKRTQSRKGSSTSTPDGGADPKAHLIELQLTEKLKPTPFFSPEERILSASPSEYESESDDSDHADDATARVVSMPLEPSRVTVSDPQESTGADSDDSYYSDEALAEPPPSSAQIVANTASIGLSGRVRNLPPPLVLQRNNEPLPVPPIHLDNSTSASSSGTSLPYLVGPAGEDLAGADIIVADMDDHYEPVRTPAEFEKRGGAVFDDLDLGLDPSLSVDDDSDDLDEHNSQARLTAQLDEIEKNLAQFSPRELTDDVDGEDSKGLKFDVEAGTENSNTERLSQSSRDTPSSPSSSLATSDQRPASPPRLAVNGISTSSPPQRPTSVEVLQNGEMLKPYSGSLSSESPVIPLSPDPFGRFPSQATPYWDNGSNRDTITSTTDSKASRFSTDSTQGSDAVSKRSTVVSVKGIRKLWRKSTKTNSIVSISSPIPPTPTLPTARLAVQQPSGARDRAGSEAGRIPMTPTFGQFPSSAPPTRPERPSQEEMEIPDIPDITDNITGAPAFQPYLGRPGGSHTPIVPTKMLPSGRDHMHRLEFDQESPYPIRRSIAPPRQASRPPSPVPSPPVLTPSPPLPESSSQRNSVRKSILKWKGAAAAGPSGSPRLPPNNLGGVSTPSLTSRQEWPQPPGGNSALAGRARRPSISNPIPMPGFDGLPDIPPSPRVPEQFLQRLEGGNRSPHYTMSSENLPAPPRKASLISRSASPSLSLASRKSDETRPSIDSSHFEMVSPRIGSSSNFS